MSSRGVAVELDVPARMRDGTILRANVFRPRGAGPWPTLLTRTPYGKDNSGEIAWSGLDPIQAARLGFMVVVQDARGRFSSEGCWQPFLHEGDDGYAAVEWVAGLAGSSGRVGMYGGSYCGNIQWLTAMRRPPSLAAIAPLLTWSEPMDGLLARGGAVELGLALDWSLKHGLDFLRRQGLDQAESRRRIDAVISDYDRLGDDGYWGLPVSETPVLRRHSVPELGSIEALADPTVASRSRVAGAYDRVAVPSLHTGGWYDVFLQGTLDNYMAMADKGFDAQLIVGPWTHLAFADPVGSRLFGIRAARSAFPGVHPAGDWVERQLEWFHHHLAGEARSARWSPPVQFFVMGSNEWRHGESWPPRAVRQRWFLHSRGSVSQANPAGTEPPSAFVYNPHNPVPTVGGHTVMWPRYPAGPIDQRAVEDRDDVLVFTSEPLRNALEVTGRVMVVIHAQSSATSTDWVARLCDVHPNGESFNLCDGIVRVPGGARGVRRYEIDLWSTSNVFLVGHRLRVHVTSSSFPRWDRALPGAERAENHHLGSARQLILHDADHPSYIELPVVT
jgi:uncharacterized protein